MSTETNSKSHTTLKSVRFAAEISIILYTPIAETAGSWLDRSELRQIKKRNHSEISNLRKLNVEILLKDTFEYPSADVQKLLNYVSQVSENSNAIRGLEMSLSEKHGGERSSMKNNCIQGVLARQNLMKSRGLEVSQIWDELCTFSNGYSFLAKRFAQRQGKADENAMKRSLRAVTTNSAANPVNHADDSSESSSEGRRISATLSKLPKPTTEKRQRRSFTEGLRQMRQLTLAMQKAKKSTTNEK